MVQNTGERVVESGGCGKFSITDHRQHDGPNRCTMDHDRIGPTGSRCVLTSCNDDRALAVLSLQHRHVRRNTRGNYDARGSTGAHLVPANPLKNDGTCHLRKQYRQRCFSSHCCGIDRPDWLALDMGGDRDCPTWTGIDHPAYDS